MRSPLDLFVIRLGWQFANTLLLIASVIAFFFLVREPAVHAFIAGAGHWGYLGAFLTGGFFVLTFTVAPATVVLYALAHALSPWPLILAASAGAVTGDYLIFRFLRERLLVEWAPVLAKLAGSPLGELFSSPFFAWLPPVVGALIIASPFPDELGLGLLSISRFERRKVLLFTFVLNAVGIALFVFAARAM